MNVLLAILATLISTSSFARLPQIVFSKHGHSVVGPSNELKFLAVTSFNRPDAKAVCVQLEEEIKPRLLALKDEGISIVAVTSIYMEFDPITMVRTYKCFVKFNADDTILTESSIYNRGPQYNAKVCDQEGRNLIRDNKNIIAVSAMYFPRAISRRSRCDIKYVKIVK